MLDFFTSIPPEWIAIALFFFASMQGADGQSWLTKLVAALTRYVVPATKQPGKVDLFRKRILDGGETVYEYDREGAPAGAIGLQNIITLLIPLIPVLLPIIQGCGKTQAVEPVPAVKTVDDVGLMRWEGIDGGEQIINLVGGGAARSALPLTWVSDRSDAGPAAWAWAGGDAEIAWPADRRGSTSPDAGAGGSADVAGVPRVGGQQCTAASCPAYVSRGSGRATVQRAHPVASLRGSCWYPGKRIFRAAGCVARAVGRLRLPGRPFARLFGRR